MPVTGPQRYYTTPSTEEPTYFNKEAALGALAGALLTIPFSGFGAIAGASVGALFGKRRIEHENLEGKLITPPSFWNFKTAVGTLAGN